MKYIDAEKLIAEIERYEETAIDAYNPLGEDADLWHGKVTACEDIKTIIASLQQEQPEADLEKEFKDYMETSEGHVLNSAGFTNKKTAYELARHFYELGLNARKEETK